jgi:CDGSH-type Zn-finger protein
MTEPKIPQKAPYVIKEQPREVFWCACGQSNNQPYCDGSHQGTEFQPMAVKVEKEGVKAWCGCKHSGNKPYSDGTHSKL